MRYLSLLLALAVVGLVGCDQALPEGVTTSAVTANAGNGPSVNGSGHEPYQSFTFHVREKRNGVQGSANLQASSGHYILDLTCFSLAGNQATMAGWITRSGDLGIEGHAAYFTAIDGGEGSDATDEISLVFFDPSGTVDPQTYCDAPPATPTSPVGRGNIQVRP